MTKITSAKRILFAFCLLLLTLVAACAPAPAPTPVPAATLPSTATVSPRVPTATSTAPTPAATNTLRPTATSTTLRPTVTATPAATSTVGPTDTPALPENLSGKVVGFSNGMLSIASDDGGTVQVSLGNPNAANVFVIPANGPDGAAYSPVADPIGALTVAARLRVSAKLRIGDGNALEDISFTLPDANAAAFPTETNQQAAVRYNLAQPTPALTPTPAGFVPTPTPVLAPRYVDMPWGKINLDLPTDEANNYAMSAWCYRDLDWVPPDRLSMWNTNPTGMVVGHAIGISVFNAEVFGKDADWSVDSQGRKYFNAYMIVRHTRSQIDTHRFVLQIYYGAQLATFEPFDKRTDNATNVVSVPATVTDINQVRIGAIYGITGSNFEWPTPVEQIQNLTLLPGGFGDWWTRKLVVYTVPFAWQATCEYTRQQYLNHWVPTPTGGLGPGWDMNKP